MNQPSDSSPMESKHKNGDSHCGSLSAYHKHISFSRLRPTRISEQKYATFVSSRFGGRYSQTGRRYEGRYNQI